MPQQRIQIINIQYKNEENSTETVPSTRKTVFGRREALGRTAVQNFVKLLNKLCEE